MIPARVNTPQSREQRTTRGSGPSGQVMKSQRCCDGKCDIQGSRRCLVVEYVTVVDLRSLGITVGVAILANIH